MKLLLDTHTLLWFVAGDSRLSDAAREALESPQNEPLVSIASLWEMAIKISLGKLDVGMALVEFARDHIEGNGIGLLGLTSPQVVRIASMPFHHRDPFDRLLIAQAQEEGIQVVGCDQAFSAYGVTLLW